MTGCSCVFLCKIVNMLKIAVLGAGHLGKIHIRCIRDIKNFELIGFYDTDNQIQREVVSEFGITCYENPEELIELADVIDIVTPTMSHYELAAMVLKKSRHVFIEKPIVTTPEEAMKLIGIAEEAKVKVQVGHVERFNPAFLAAKPFLTHPMFIESHRLAYYNPRGTDVSVILDLMIHDLDIILSVVKANVKRISASGVPVISDTPDIANARIEFDNGCVANITASRISMKNMRKIRFFQKDAYISIDFLKKSTEVIRMKTLRDDEVSEPDALIFDLPHLRKRKEIIIEKPEIKEINAIKTELESFYSSIVNNVSPEVSIIDGYNAINLAHQIIDKINRTLDEP